MSWSILKMAPDCVNKIVLCSKLRAVIKRCSCEKKKPRNQWAVDFQTCIGQKCGPLCLDNSFHVTFCSQSSYHDGCRWPGVYLTPGHLQPSWRLGLVSAYHCLCWSHWTMSYPWEKHIVGHQGWVPNEQTLHTFHQTRALTIYNLYTCKDGLYIETWRCS